MIINYRDDNHYHLSQRNGAAYHALFWWVLREFRLMMLAFITQIISLSNKLPLQTREFTIVIRFSPLAISIENIQRINANLTRTARGWNRLEAKFCFEKQISKAFVPRRWMRKSEIWYRKIKNFSREKTKTILKPKLIKSFGENRDENLLRGRGSKQNPFFLHLSNFVFDEI